jgi:hypothetical protein
MKNENVRAAELSETTTAPTVEEGNSHEKGIRGFKSAMKPIDTSTKVVGDQR